MKRVFLIPSLLIAFTAGCERSDMKPINIDLTELNNIPQQNWSNLVKKKIFFGHQSVGFNIVDGIKDITREMPNIKLKIKETKDPSDFSAPIFAHSQVGQNKSPFSKCDDFKKIMDSGVGNMVDIAFFKFCYVDVVGDTDNNEVFKHYDKTMKYLELKYPKVRFIHFTIPVRTSPIGIKAKIKRFLGFSIEDDIDNIKRNEFNKLLIEKYGKKSKLFDIAEYESTYPDGERSYFKFKENKYFCMAPEYTKDKGHLNEIGRKIIAKKLLVFLQSQNIR